MITVLGTPMPVWMDELLSFLGTQTGNPIMAGESVFDDHVACRLIRQNACDLINIKLSKPGGILGAPAIHSLCEAPEVSNMPGGMQ